MHRPAGSHQRKRRDGDEAQTGPVLGRDLTQGAGIERLGVGGVEYLDARPFEAREVAEIRRQVGTVLQIGCEQPTQVADRGMLGRMSLQVPARRALEVRPQERCDARKVVAQHVAQPSEVGVDVDADSGARIERRARRDQLHEAGCGGATARLVGERAPEKALQLTQA